MLKLIKPKEEEPYDKITGINYGNWVITEAHLIELGKLFVEVDKKLVKIFENATQNAINNTIANIKGGRYIKKSKRKSKGTIKIKTKRVYK